MEHVSIVALTLDTAAMFTYAEQLESGTAKCVVDYTSPHLANLTYPTPHIMMRPKPDFYYAEAFFVPGFVYGGQTSLIFSCVIGAPFALLVIAIVFIFIFAALDAIGRLFALGGAAAWMYLRETGAYAATWWSRGLTFSERWTVFKNLLFHTGNPPPYAAYEDL